MSYKEAILDAFAKWLVKTYTMSLVDYDNCSSNKRHMLADEFSQFVRNGVFTQG